MGLEGRFSIDGFVVERVDVFTLNKNSKKWVVSLTKSGKSRRWLSFTQQNYPKGEDIAKYYMEKYNDEKTQ